MTDRRSLIRPQLTRKNVIDNRHRLRRGPVVGREHAASQQRDSHRFEIAPPDDSPPRRNLAAISRDSRFGRCRVDTVALAAERQYEIAPIETVPGRDASLDVN